ncbi:hypothetical protein LCGC14_2523260 [marine sediment metagenome]|uniref:Uncharacterized protein n=1 Tax=marine sediment metagenome TaxID=412755 RepID=A0A0F9D7F2_9ZZZZ
MVNGNDIEIQLRKNIQVENEIANRQARLALGRPRSVRDLERIRLKKGNF